MNVVVLVVRAFCLLLGGLLVFVLWWFLPWAFDDVSNQLNLIYLALAGVLLGFLTSRFVEGQVATWLVKAWGKAVLWPPGKVVSGVVGLVMGLLASSLMNTVLSPTPFYSFGLMVLPTLALTAFWTYFAVVNSAFFEGWFAAPGEVPLPRIVNAKVLDVSVVLDSRLVELVRVGLLEGTLVVPREVLRELQLLELSEDQLRRTRGKKGLGVLDELKSMRRLEVVSSASSDATDVAEAVLLVARSLHGQVVTMDFAFAERAAEQNIRALNVLRLVDALRSPLVVGDVLRVRVEHLGREPGQGIAYLDDGTMLVVRDGASFKGKEADVVIVQHVQSMHGRMIFAERHSA